MKLIFKFLIIAVFVLSLGFFVYSQVEECPFGVVNDPEPGKCGLYTDQNQDGICDYSQNTKNEEIKNQVYQDSNRISSDKYYKFPVLYINLISFFGIILFFSIATFFYHKYGYNPKKVFNLFCYILFPIAIAFWVWYVGYFQGIKHFVYEAGRWTGYLSIWLLFILLIAKPLMIFTQPSKTKLSNIIHKFSIFIMMWRKQFGILVFYLAFGHFLTYTIFELVTANTIPKNQLAYISGIVGLVALGIGYITSNNFSIKKLGKKWIWIQKIAYLAYIGGTIHIYFINKTYGLLFIIIGLIYMIIRILSTKK